MALVVGGIGAHRSILSHSIIMGSALEALLLAVLSLVRLVHDRLPEARDPLWDAIHEQAVKITEASAVGVNLGMAYHLLVDGLVQPAAYKDLPLALPVEGHQALMVANAASEGLDRRSTHVPQVKPLLGQPICTRPSPIESEEATGGKALVRAHKQYLAQGFVVDYRAAPHLAAHDLQLLRRHGAWLTALEDGVLKPMTPAQMRFIAVARNQLTAESEHERAWHAYRTIQQRLGIN